MGRNRTRKPSNRCEMTLISQSPSQLLAFKAWNWQEKCFTERGSSVVHQQRKEEKKGGSHLIQGEKMG